ncbi:MAG: hypothetical protein ABIS36_22945 [Chryseolinea sp.]
MNNQQINLDYADEIAMGPRLYRLSIDGSPIKKKIFFKACVLDSERNQIAITQYSYGTEDIESTLWVIDIESKRGFEISKQTNGYIEPLRFEGSRLFYSTHPFNAAGDQFERDFSDIRPTTF